MVVYSARYVDEIYIEIMQWQLIYHITQPYNGILSQSNVMPMTTMLQVFATIMLLLLLMIVSTVSLAGPFLFSRFFVFMNDCTST